MFLGRGKKAGSPLFASLDNEFVFLMLYLIIHLVCGFESPIRDSCGFKRTPNKESPLRGVGVACIRGGKEG